MKIKKIISQHRRDFRAIYECDHCDCTIEWSGYDDDHFHKNVIPLMACPTCGKTAGADYRQLQPLHPQDAVI